MLLLFLGEISDHEIKRATGDKKFYCIEPGDYRVIDQFEEKKKKAYRYLHYYHLECWY